MGRWGDNYQLPITNYQFPIINSQFPINYSDEAGFSLSRQDDEPDVGADFFAAGAEGCLRLGGDEERCL